MKMRCFFVLLLSITLVYSAFGEDVESRMKTRPTGLFGGAAFTNPYLSLIFNGWYYGSDLKQSDIDGRTIPGFTNEVPENRSKGFNFESAELFIFAPVDPYFNLYATIPVTEEGAEMEEAYFLTTSLPAGLQVKGGKFRSGFGRINGQHPHAWDFVDVPLNYRAFLGPEGMVEKGVQLTYLPSLPVYTQLGVEVLQDKPAEEGPGRPLRPSALPVGPVAAGGAIRRARTVLPGAAGHRCPRRARLLRSDRHAKNRVSCFPFDLRRDSGRSEGQDRDDDAVDRQHRRRNRQG